jgi:hypothetical protein
MGRTMPAAAPGFLYGGNAFGYNSSFLWGTKPGQAKAKLMKAKSEQPSRGQAAKQKLSEEKRGQALASKSKQGQAMANQKQSKAIKSGKVCITAISAATRAQATFSSVTKSLKTVLKYKGTQLKGATNSIDVSHRGS